MKKLNENKLLHLSNSYIFTHALDLLQHLMLYSYFSNFLAIPKSGGHAFRCRVSLVVSMASLAHRNSGTVLPSSPPRLVHTGPAALPPHALIFSSREKRRVDFSKLFTPKTESLVRDKLNTTRFLSAGHSTLLHGVYEALIGRVHQLMTRAGDVSSGYFIWDEHVTEARFIFCGV